MRYMADLIAFRIGWYFIGKYRRRLLDSEHDYAKLAVRLRKDGIKEVDIALLLLLGVRERFVNLRPDKLEPSTGEESQQAKPAPFYRSS